ncbi:hypothetical protein O9X98_14510 [Agrobacterium salinitolerans]|nr:hypothetical protein [Agrobacterium salinitolerans]
MKVATKLTIIAITLVWLTYPAAAECDFQKEVGNCTGAIKLLKSGGSKPSYSAEIRVSSSAPSCSKVEYYLDNTPNTTVLKSGNSAEESLFGTKPITKGSISVTGCKQYASVGEVKQQKTERMDMHQCIAAFKAELKAKSAKAKMGIAGFSEAYCE